MEQYYSPGQVEAILRHIGVDIVGETETNLLCLCSYHHNTDTPALSVEKDRGIFLCFASHCGEKGTLSKLIKYMTKSNDYATRRIIDKYRSDTRGNIDQIVDDIFSKKDTLPYFEQEKLDQLHADLWKSPGQVYMNGRGFTDNTLDYFKIGYSVKKNMIAIPLHDWDSNPVGLIGRTVEGKRFENSKQCPTRRTLFNIHRAKRTGDTVVILESATDAMRLWQFGISNVVSTNGSIFSEAHVQLINKYFNNIIIMTDLDDPKDYVKLDCPKCENTCLGHSPGRALGEKMVKALPGKRIKWASYDYGTIFPHGAKDPGDMSAVEVKQCIDNAVNTAEYEMWKREFPELAVV